MIISFKEKFVANIAAGALLSGNSFSGMYPLHSPLKGQIQPKLHTIRLDENNRYKPEAKIQFWLGNPRNKHSNPSIKQFGHGEIKSFQWLRFVWSINSFEKAHIFPFLDPTYSDKEGKSLYVIMGAKNVPKQKIDTDGFVLNENHLYRLARYDGFDTIDELLQFFESNRDDYYKLIHWTDDEYKKNEEHYIEEDMYHNYNQ